jgi:hypothetical protein
VGVCVGFVVVGAGTVVAEPGEVVVTAAVVGG